MGNGERVRKNQKVESREQSVFLGEVGGGLIKPPPRKISEEIILSPHAQIESKAYYFIKKAYLVVLNCCRALKHLLILTKMQ